MASTAPNQSLARRSRTRVADTVHRVVGQVDRHRESLAATCTGIILMATVAPILMTPYRADDVVNRGIPAGIAASGQTLLEGIWSGTAGATRDWMAAQGRFFPGSMFWTHVVFSLFSGRETYKVFLALLSVSMVLLAALLAARLTGRRAVGALTVVALASTMTLRAPWFDGLDSFAGLLPWTVCLFLATLLLLLHGESWRSSLGAAVLWSLALTTYEVAIVLTPVLVAVVWLRKRRLWRSLAVAWPTALDAVVVLYLRAQATNLTPAYSTNFAPEAVVRTYVRQTVAALPLAQLWYPGSSGIAVPKRLVVIALVGIGTPALIALWCLARMRLSVARADIGVVAALGAAIWLLTPVFIAVTTRWQTELPPGQGYLAVVWGYLGVALLGVAAWLAAARWWTGSASRASAWVFGGVTVALAVAVAVNLAQSYSVVGWLLQAMNATATLLG